MRTRKRHTCREEASESESERERERKDTESQTSKAQKVTHKQIHFLVVCKEFLIASKEAYARVIGRVGGVEELES